MENSNIMNPGIKKWGNTDGSSCSWEKSCLTDTEAWHILNKRKKPGEATQPVRVVPNLSAEVLEHQK